MKHLENNNGFNYYNQIIVLLSCFFARK